MKLPGTTKRGGKRDPVGGRPKTVKNHSDILKRSVEKGCEKLAKLTGKEFGEVLAELAWGYEVVNGAKGQQVVGIEIQDSVRLAAQRLIAHSLVVKEKKQAMEEVKRPTMYIPEYREKKQGEGQDVHLWTGDPQNDRHRQR